MNENVKPIKNDKTSTKMGDKPVIFSVEEFLELNRLLKNSATQKFGEAVLAGCPKGIIVN